MSEVRQETVWRWPEEKAGPDALAVEEPLEIRVDGRPISITMRTPGHDGELAAGFLLSEGVIREMSDLERVEPDIICSDQNVVNVYTAEHLTVDFRNLTRHVFASSSCGICGKASIGSVRTAYPPIRRRATPPPSLLARLPARMRQSQTVFDRTGGLHAAALFDEDGTLRVLREDVGRHNAVDKVLGHALAKGWVPLEEQILLVSGRVSFEVVQKALAGGIATVAAVSAPTSLAVKLARENGQTLVGFLREGRMNVYT